jgi:SAM-dependent methyltransferase
LSNSYDVVRYPSWPVSNTHPARIGAVNALFGLPFVPFARCRVLEIGCGNGVNLMSMAVGAPDAEFVGIDLAEKPIAYGRALAEAAGLTNVHLKAEDVTRTGAAIGLFDYIICHGVYAWVPPPVRQAIMALIGAALGENGVAFVSYNADPGCRIRQILRDLMLDQVSGTEEPAERVKAAHEALQAFIDVWSDADPFQSALKTEALDMLKRPAALLYHDELGEFYAPQRLNDMVDAARVAGLDYLCDMRGRDLGAMCSNPESFDTQHWVRVERARDFAEMRRFRQSILRRAGDPIDRRFKPESLKHLWAAAALTPMNADAQDAGVFAFSTPKGAEYETRDPRLTEFLTRLGQAFPAPLPCAEIIDDGTVCEAILALYVKDIVELTTAPLPFAVAAGEYPLASPLARAQIAQGEDVLSALHHRAIRLGDDGARGFVALLDGARSHADIVRDMARETRLTEQEIAGRLPEALREIGRNRLLLA